MYCSVVPQKMKRKPPNSGVFRDPKIKIADHDIGTFEIVGKDEITREPRGKWRIILNKSSRQGNKILKKQWYISTITYWDIVEYSYVEPDELRLILHSHGVWGKIGKHFPDMDLNEKKNIYFPMVDKFIPIQQAVLREHKKSYEYKYWIIQEELIEKHKKELKEALKEKVEEELKEEQREKRRAQRRKSQRKRPNKKHFNVFGTTSQNDKTEKSITVEIIEAGFKKMAKKYHPDAGGDEKKMKELNRIKEEMLRSFKD